MFADRRVMTDALGALALGAVVIGITTVAAVHQPDANPLWPGGYALLAGAALPLLARRRFPLPVFAVSIACTLIYYWTGFPGGPAILLPALALYALTTVRGALMAGIAGAAVLVASYIAFVASGRGWLPGAPSAGFVAGIAAVIGIGAAVRSRKAAADANREQREEHERRMAEQERLRIAREVHDVVAHSLAMINVQAGVAVHVADRRPEQAKEALRNIKTASAEALADLRATLAVLRSGDATAPAPSLRMLDGLLDHARAAGLAVTVRGDSGELPAPVDAAAYRILQESLTNVIRHADNARSVDIGFERSGGELTLVVRDDGEPPRSPKPGNGLRGMRERADALGGKVDAGPSAEGTGFQVRAVLPVEG